MAEGPNMPTNLNLRKKIKKELQCSICFEQFADPVVLPCGHTFCMLCIDEYVERERSKGKQDLRCPYCKNKIAIVGPQPTFPKALHLQKIMDMIDEMEKICENDDNVAEYFCHKCCAIFCNECKIQHIDHNLLDIASIHMEDECKDIAEHLLTKEGLIHEVNIFLEHIQKAEDDICKAKQEQESKIKTLYGKAMDDIDKEMVKLECKKGHLKENQNQLLQQLEEKTQIFGEERVGAFSNFKLNLDVDANCNITKNKTQILRDEEHRVFELPEISFRNGEGTEDGCSQLVTTYNQHILTRQGFMLNMPKPKSIASFKIKEKCVNMTGDSVGNIVIVHGNLMGVKCYNPYGSYKWHFNSLRRLYDVTLMSSKNILVSPHKHPHLIQLNPKTLGSFMKDFKVTLHTYEHLLLASHLNHIVIAPRYDAKVYIVNVSTYHTEISFNVFIPVNFLHVTKDGTIVISNAEMGPAVKGFSLGGKRLFTYGREDLLNSVHGISSFSNGNIIIADCGNNKIHLLSPRGVFIKYLLTDEDGIAQPDMLALSGDAYLYVTSLSDSTKLSVWSCVENNEDEIDDNDTGISSISSTDLKTDGERMSLTKADLDSPLYHMNDLIKTSSTICAIM